MIAHLATIISCLAIFLVVPTSVDSFEAPKRLVFAVLAVLLSLTWRRLRQLPCLAMAALPVLFLMVLRAWMNGFPAYGLVPLAIWAIPFVLFLSAAVHSSALRGGHLFTVIAYAGLFEAVVMILQRHGFDPFFASTTSQIAYLPGRMIGTIGYQNQAAEFLGIALLCLFAAKGRNIVKVFSAITMVSALAMTANRGALLGLFFASVAVAVVFLLRRKWALKFFALSIFVLVSASSLLFLTPELRTRVAEMKQLKTSQAVQSRRWMARVALDIFYENPVFGAGPGEYAFQYLDRLGGTMPDAERRRAMRSIVYARETHCDILQFAAEFGVVGLLLLLAFIASLVASLRRVASSGNVHDRRIAFSVAMSLLFLMVCSCFNFTFQTPLAGGFAGLLAGVAVEGGGKRNTATSKHTWAMPFQILASLYVLIMVAVENADNMLNRNTLAASAISAKPLPAWASGRTLSEVAATVDIAGAAGAAIPIFDRALNSYVSPTVLMNYGHALASTGNYQDAAIVYKRLEASGLQNCEAMMNLSLVLEKDGRIKESVDVERKRLSIYAHNFTEKEVFRYAALLIRIADYETAHRIVGDFKRRCDAVNPGGWSAEWDNIAGVVSMKLGNYDMARMQFENALKRNPQLRSAQKNLEGLNGL